jgi:tetratricopeptide (TPR) repeat protein
MSSANLTKLKRKATELEQKKEFEKALALYIQIVDEAGRELDDVDLQLYNRVGDLLTRQNEVSEAMAYYEKAVDVYAERGFLNNAIALCNKILRQSPGRTSVYYKLGKISAKKGFKNDARKNFLEYADRMQQGGHVDEAFRALKEFADLCPDQDDIRLMLADLLTKENRSGEALEQLERLYAKLEEEGRGAEARATMDRIKAIDPDITPRPSGAFITQRSNDLVFLDLDDAEPSPRSGTPVPARATPLPPVETVDVRGLGALQGLAITFLPDDEADAVPPAAVAAEVAALDGLEPTENPALAEEVLDVAAMPDLEAPVTASDAPVEEVLPVDHSEWSTPDEVVPLVDGLATSASTLTGVHPHLAPLLDEPPLSTEEFGALTLDAASETELVKEHDLSLSSTLPLMAADPADPGDAGAGESLLGLLDQTIEGDEQSIVAPGMLDAPPDPWAAAALGAARDDARAEPALPDAAGEAAAPGAGEAGLHDQPGARAELAPVPDDESRDGSRIGDSFDADSLKPEADRVTPAAVVEQEAAADTARSAVDEPARAEPLPDDAGPEAIGEAAEPEAGARDDATPRAVAPTLPPEFALEDFVAGDPGSVLDTSTLRAGFGLETPTPVAPMLVPDSLLAPPPAAEVREEDVELPLLDLEKSPFTPDGSPATFDESSEDLDKLLAAPPSFGTPPETPGFVPPPMDLGPNGTTDEWASPEVLIDGEWRDEHMGDLVSGEAQRVGTPRQGGATGDRSTFDDLAAAMLDADRKADGTPGDRDEHASASASTAAPATRAHATPRSTLSFGGLEAQLRRRLELDPTDASLRRQLGEALLDLGQREEGLYELEVAALDCETRGDLGTARDILDVILRVTPLSVPHHQKRVEYAARSGDRPRLVHAYTELADALFRCGEPDKARVVYSRVLELSPGNERAAFALSVLSDDPGAPRSTDELASIHPEPLQASPLPALDTSMRPESKPLAAMPPAGVIAEAPRSPEARPAATGDDAIDAEVDAAFADEVSFGEEVLLEPVAGPPAPGPDRTAAPPPAAGHPPDGFVDLGSWFHGAERARSTRMVTTDVVPSGDEHADFAEMLRRFKQGVAENVEDEDFASHYDLGVAFKEMGLMDEAIAQFQKSLRGPEHRIRSYEALGQCFVEKDQHQVAAALLQRVADAAGVDDQQLVGVLYLMGYACESVGRQKDAVGYYQRVFAVDIEFRDVRNRLAALERNAK